MSFSRIYWVGKAVGWVGLGGHLGRTAMPKKRMIKGWSISRAAPAVGLHG
jgi:hypothetical protein